MTEADLIDKINQIDWEFSNCDTQYLTHNIHRYSGKFIPQIAATAIELLSSPGDCILDSYMGSGTTLLEAKLKNRNAIGVDINPLAVLISTVKNTPVTPLDILELDSVVVPFVNGLLSDGQLSFVTPTLDKAFCLAEYNDNLWRLEDAWNKKWYQEDVLQQLVEIYSCIISLKNKKAMNIALVAFSDILRKSSNASSKYPNVMYDKNTKKKPLPAKSFLDSLMHVKEAVIQMSEAVAGHSGNIDIMMQNNLNLELMDNSVDAIITHPPYIAAVPYAEYGCLSLNWLGYDSKELDLQLTGGKRHSKKVVSRFEDDYEKYFIESYRVLKPNGYMFLMVGNPTAHGERVDLNQMTVDLAIKAGFKHISTAIRQGQNRRGNKMGEEYLIFVQKNG